MAVAVAGERESARDGERWWRTIGGDLLASRDIERVKQRRAVEREGLDDGQEIGFVEALDGAQHDGAALERDQHGAIRSYLVALTTREVAFDQLVVMVLASRLMRLGSQTQRLLLSVLGHGWISELRTCESTREERKGEEEGGRSKEREIGWCPTRVDRERE